MTASAVFILDVKGKVIISRNFRGDVPMNCVERFSGHVLEADEADERPVVRARPFGRRLAEETFLHGRGRLAFRRHDLRDNSVGDAEELL